MSRVVHVGGVILACCGIALAEGPPEPTRKARFQAVDLNVGGSAEDALDATALSLFAGPCGGLGEIPVAYARRSAHRRFAREAGSA
jgi:hypothetical protein